MRKTIRNKWVVCSLIILSVCMIWINYTYVSYTSTSFIFNNQDDIPIFKYALFLGTPKYLPDGNINNYYKNRINTTAQLYSQGKINNIIISADSLNKYQENEVQLIASDLIKKGIDQSHLVLDNNGNSTWKSITNLKKQNTLNKVLIISQKFHLERALYISKRENIDAIGFQAEGKMSNKLWVREILARVKMQIDLTIN